MLTPDILKALKGYTANIRNDVALVLQTGAHPKRDELKRFLEDFAWEVPGGSVESAVRHLSTMIAAFRQQQQ